MCIYLHISRSIYFSMFSLSFSLSPNVYIFLQRLLIFLILSVTFYGSNDFHHVALALIRRLRTPVNMVLFDNHPDWLLNPFGHHCGSWYNIVCSLDTVQQGNLPSRDSDVILAIFCSWKREVSWSHSNLNCTSSNLNYWMLSLCELVSLLVYLYITYV